MALVVFDADVLIGYLHRGDAHHELAVERLRRASEPGNARCVSALNYSEVLIGPLRRSRVDGQRAERFFDAFAFEIVDGDRVLARHAAAVRARTGLKLPDAYAVATAIVVATRGSGDVRLESFDAAVMKAYGDIEQTGESR